MLWEGAYDTSTAHWAKLSSVRHRPGARQAPKSSSRQYIAPGQSLPKRPDRQIASQRRGGGALLHDVHGVISAPSSDATIIPAILYCCCYMHADNTYYTVTQIASKSTTILPRLGHSRRGVGYCLYTMFAVFVCNFDTRCLRPMIWFVLFASLVYRWKRLYIVIKYSAIHWQGSGSVR